MKTHVVKTTPEASLSEVVDLMDIYQVNSLPVVDSDGRLCGIIAEDDVVRATIAEARKSERPCSDAESDSLVHFSPEAANLVVGQVMQRSVVSVQENLALESAARSLIINDFTRLPVTTTNGEVIGTLNRIDVLQAVFERNLRGAGA